MDVKEALIILDRMCLRAQASRQEHMMAVEALKTLETAIKEKEGENAKSDD